MIEIRPSGEEPEPTHLARVVPEQVPEPGFQQLRASLWCALPAMAMLTGA